LVAHPSVASHTLAQLSGVAETDATSAPLVLIDTAGCDCEEDTTGAAGKGIQVREQLYIYMCMCIYI